MALNDAIAVVERTAPKLIKQLLDSRNDSISTESTFGISNSQNIIDITGYTFELVIKRTPVGVRAQDGYPQVYDSDTFQLTYDGVIESAEDGTFSFQLDARATACYGQRIAEIRWWSDTADLTGPPTDRVIIDYVVSRRLSGA